MLNSCNFTGRLTASPEFRYTPANVPVLSFCIACDRDRKNEEGEREADFINCVAWRHTAEFVSKYFGKGDMMTVSGRLQIRDYTDKDGNKRRSSEIICENVYFGESRRKDSGQENGDRISTLRNAFPSTVRYEDDGELPY